MCFCLPFEQSTIKIYYNRVLSLDPLVYRDRLWVPLGVKLIFKAGFSAMGGCCCRAMRPCKDRVEIFCKFLLLVVNRILVNRPGKLFTPGGRVRDDSGIIPFETGTSKINCWCCCRHTSKTLPISLYPLPSSVRNNPTHFAAKSRGHFCSELPKESTLKEKRTPREQIGQKPACRGEKTSVCKYAPFSAHSGTQRLVQLNLRLEKRARHTKPAR